MKNLNEMLDYIINQEKWMSDVCVRGMKLMLCETHNIDDFGQLEVMIDKRKNELNLWGL